MDNKYLLLPLMFTQLKQVNIYTINSSKSNQISVSRELEI